MPVAVTYPGVYVQEIPSGVHTIAGVSTSLTAFVGTATRGPVNTLTRIQSFGEYVSNFGNLDAASEMSYAVMQYFLNGGSDSLVIRVAAGATSATFTLKDGGGADALKFTAEDGAAAGNGVAIAVDYPTADPIRFRVTLTGLPDASGNSAVEVYSALSMNSTDANYVVTVINAASGLATVERKATGFGKGSSANQPPADLTKMDASHNTIRVAVDGQFPKSVTFSIPPSDADILAKLNAAVAGTATATNPSAHAFVITSNSTSDHSSVLALPGLANDASRVLGFGAANGGVEKDGSAPVRPAQGPAPGTLVGAAVTLASLANHADGNIVLTLDGGRPATVALHISDLAAPAAQVDCDVFAQRIQDAVRASRPTVAAFSGFMAKFDFASRVITLSSGTRGAASSVLVGTAPGDTLATVLGLDTGVQTAGGAWALGGGSETALTSGNAYATFFPPPANKQGVYALEDADIFNILCLPGIADPAILQDAAAYCEQRRAFLIVDPPPGNTLTQIEALVSGPTLPKSDHAAIYYPNIKIGDPLSGGQRLSAPSGTLAGLYARTDSTRGVWKAPAGVAANLNGAQAVERPMSNGENGVINPLGVNAIRQLNPYGIVSWGARTLRGGDAFGSDYKYIPVRRLALYIEESLYRGTQWVVFEPNDESLWAAIRLNVGVFMASLFRQGAFAGASPREAYFVKCDGETTPQADVDRGVVNIIVGFAPLKPAEFVVISIVQIAGQLAT
jgi:phage tail sheath protein FI